MWAKPAGWLTSCIFLHLFPHRTQLPFNNTTKELEAGLQAKPFWSSLVPAAPIPGTFAVFQEPWPEEPWAQPQTWTGPLDGLIYLLGLSTPVCAARDLHRSKDFSTSNCYQSEAVFQGRPGLLREAKSSSPTPNPSFKAGTQTGEWRGVLRNDGGQECGKFSGSLGSQRKEERTGREGGLT